MRYRVQSLVICGGLSVFAFGGCNGSEGNRFNDQESDYIFDSNTSTLKAFGAGRMEDSSDRVFRCPSVSGMGTESSLTLFRAKAYGLEPHFTLHSIPEIRADGQGGVGISLSDLPVGVLDIYERCHASSYDRLTTVCPKGYDIVETCSESAANKDECRLIHEGSHRLVISAQVSDDERCLTEEMDRSPYHTSAPMVANACDAFSPIELPAVYRVTQPSDNCCQASDAGTLDFCFKPCGCRTLSIRVLPKEDWFAQTREMSDRLRIGVFSNVEGHDNALDKLLESMDQKGVDVAMSLGNLTKKGAKDEFLKVHDTIKSHFLTVDGAPNSTVGCLQSGEKICCLPDTRQFDNSMCNAIVHKVAFHAGLGEDEYSGSGLSTFREIFGPSNMATTLGKVQLIMLDTADASVGSAQMEWLSSILTTTDQGRCQIPAPEREKWPTLAECRDILNIEHTKKPTCRECIQQEAYCIPPEAERSDPSLGPENCVCVPASSQVCAHAQTCAKMDGTEAACLCSRDEDCGEGGTCMDGICEPPIRLVFSYTPIFDVFGSRNNAILSKPEAATLMSMMTQGGVDAVFSGRVLDYSQFTMGGIPMYITGGGGASMASFAEKKHHWLYVDIPKAYSRPNPQDISVEVVEFDLDD